MINGSKRSGRDKGVSFFRIPKIISNRHPRCLEVSKKPSAGYMQALSRDDLTEKILRSAPCISLVPFEFLEFLLHSGYMWDSTEFC